MSLDVSTLIEVLSLIADDPNIDDAIKTEAPHPRNLGHAIHERFGALGSVDLPEAPREAIRQPVDFEE